MTEESRKRPAPQDHGDAQHMPERRQAPVPITDAIERIVDRIPPEWDRQIYCDEGWWALLAELDARLAHLDPHYEVHQVKEKFGTLSFYAYTERHPEIGSRFDGIIAAAEAASAFICEKCGAVGGIAKRKTWRKTLCHACAAQSGYELP